MNHNFTDEVRKALAMAREEALRLGHDYVGTEHMLLALAWPGWERRSVLAAVGLDPEAVRADVLGFTRRGVSAGRRGELPYTSRAKVVLEQSMREAKERKDAFVDLPHLLLGLIREERGIAAQVLSKHGVDAAVARQRLADGATRPEGHAERADGGRAAFAIAIDDASSSSIYEQIVAQVQEAVATGRVSPGERLPAVRRLADELDIAPGTVARAYGELERLGVVLTDGARGTRVADRTRSELKPAARAETLVGLLRPVVVAAFHLGASADELRSALAPAMAGIYPPEAAA